MNLFINDGETIPTAPAKHPNDLNRTYGVDWSSDLEEGETISASEWIAPQGLTVASLGFDGANTTASVTGGNANVDYLVANKITTNLGEYSRSMIIPCRVI